MISSPVMISYSRAKVSHYYLVNPYPAFSHKVGQDRRSNGSDRWFCRGTDLVNDHDGGFCNVTVSRCEGKRGSVQGGKQKQFSNSKWHSWRGKIETGCWALGPMKNR